METAPTAFPALSPRKSAAFAARSVETAHVGFLLMTEAIPYEDCRNLFSPETGQVSEILAWVAFPGLSSGDFDALEAAGLPLVRSGLGTWV